MFDGVAFTSLFGSVGEEWPEANLWKELFDPLAESASFSLAYAAIGAVPESN